MIASGQRVDTPFFLGLLAQLEAEADRAESALARLDEAFARANHGESRFYLAFLYRLRGEILLKRESADLAPAEQALQTAIAIAKQQGARSLGLQAALGLAKLYQSTGRPSDAHAVLARALEGFAATPEMPEIAEAQALLAALMDTAEVKAAEAQRERRLHLQTAYGQAVMWSKGFGAEETKEAFARAAELAANSGDFSQRFAAAHGQWTFALVRGEFKSAREMASAFLREAEAEGRLIEAGVARRGLALISYFLGDFVEARTHCERALATCEPERDREARERFSEDTGCTVMSVLAQTSWQLGEAERAHELSEMANRRAAELGHAPSMAHPLQTEFFLELLRGDASAALAAAEALAALGRDHGMPHWLADAELYAVWARCRLHEPTAGAALAAWQGRWSGGWFSKALLAELELETHGAESAVARIDEALVLAGQAELRCDLPFAHLLRGEILLKRDSTNSAPAEEAFQTAVAIAREQGARSWGLRAALALAKLYQSTGRLVEAHEVLRPALEGWPLSPLSLWGEGSGVRAPADLRDVAEPSSPALLPVGEGGASAEMPELREAVALLAALAETDEVKADSARRERRFKLETGFALAVGWSKGFGGEEARLAFGSVAEGLATDSGAGIERFAAHEANWAMMMMRGEIASARHAAEQFLSVAERARSLPDEAAARRSLGATLAAQGDLAEASKFLKQALELADRVPDRDRAVRARPDPGATAAAHLSLASWIMGDLDRSRALIEDAAARTKESEQIPTLMVVRYLAALREMLGGDARASLPFAQSFIDFCRARGVAQFLGAGEAIAAWAHARLEGNGFRLSEFRKSLAALSEQGHRFYLPHYLGRLGELELAEQHVDAALSTIRDAQALAQETGQRVFDGFLDRVAGEALLAADRANAPAAEAAFLSAIEASGQQGARSFALQAALALAKLYQSTARPAEAHAVLAPALDGFPALSLLPSWRKPVPSEAREAGDEGPPASSEAAAKALTPDPSPDPRVEPGEERGTAYAEMPELRQAQALLVELAGNDEVKAEAAQRQRRGQLQVAYGNALIAARGFAAPETAEAFAKARALATSTTDASERIAADFGLWAGSYARGDLPAMRSHAADFLAEVAACPDAPEAGVAHRIQGTTHWFAGEFLEARERLERALALFEPGRDDDLAYRFGIDPGVPGMAYLAFASWSLGENARAISLIERMGTRIASLTHTNTLALGTMHAAMFALMSGDRSRARVNVSDIARIVREHDLRLFRAFGAFLEGWATADAGAPAEGLEGMRRGAESLREQNTLVFDGLIKIALSDGEARAGDLGRAVAVLDEALATAERTGYRAFEAELRRTRGELLLKLGPANPASAEQEFQAAIAVARQQRARSFELRAALALAKLYQSMGRPAEAHKVLAQALEDWPRSPLLPFGRKPVPSEAREARDEGTPVSNETTGALTPNPSPARERGTRLAEMPELQEAEALLTALAAVT